MKLMNICIQEKKCYIFNVKAVETKYLLVSFASKVRYNHANIALTIANLRAGYAPDII